MINIREGFACGAIACAFQSIQHTSVNSYHSLTEERNGKLPYSQIFIFISVELAQFIPDEDPISLHVDD